MKMTQIIKSKSLSSDQNLIHGISTRDENEPPNFNNLSKHVGDDIVAVMKNRARFFGSLGISESNLVHANQVYADGVTIISSPSLYPQTDALISQHKNLFLVISVADCMPVMMYDPENNVIANVHSGWRGTQKNIAGKSIVIMQKEFGTNPAELIIFMGPAISKKSFEVDKDVADMFSEKYVAPKHGAHVKYLVDTVSVVNDSLLAAGVSHANIEHCPICTYEDSSTHSYRRDKSRSGRMFAVIGIITNSEPRIKCGVNSASA